MVYYILPMNEIYDFYNNGAEIGRLERGLGIVRHGWRRRAMKSI